MEQKMNLLFNQDFTVKQVKKYVDYRIKEIELPIKDWFKDIKDKIDMFLRDEDKNTFSSIETILTHVYRMMCTIHNYNTVRFTRYTRFQWKWRFISIMYQR